MYESNEKQIDWSPILKKAGIFAGILLIVVIIVLLVSNCTKKDENEPSNVESPVTLSKEIDLFEDALLKYLNKDNLPKELNSSKTVRLKMLQDKELISTLVDSENNTCESNESFAEVTKFENNYAVNISLTCGSNKENRIIYVGCFSECNGSVCKGDAEMTGGICGEESVDQDQTGNDNTSTNPDNTTKPSTNNSSSNNKPNSSTNNKPSTSTTTKPSTSKPSTTKPNESSKPSTPTTPTKPSQPSDDNDKVETMYEYKKCDTYYICDSGELNSNNKCEVEEKRTDYQSLLIRTVRSQKPNLHELNQGNRTYIYKDFVDGWYRYTEYYCDNQAYYVDLKQKRCYGTIINKVEVAARERETCSYTWSYATSMDGWVKTGNTR